jgi:hypothetical protein
MSLFFFETLTFFSSQGFNRGPYFWNCSERLILHTLRVYSHQSPWKINDSNNPFPLPFWSLPIIHSKNNYILGTYQHVKHSPPFYYTTNNSARWLNYFYAKFKTKTNIFLFTGGLWTHDFSLFLIPRSLYSLWNLSRKWGIVELRIINIFNT